MSVTNIDKRRRRQVKVKRPGSLMGAKEVAQELRVTVGLRTTVSNLKDVVGLPLPIDNLKCGRIWDAREIRRFAKARAERKSRVAAA